MILEPAWSAAFIGDYKQVLLDLAGPGEKHERMLDTLIRGRNRLVQDRRALAASLAALRARNALADEEAVEAIQGLQVARWIYLRDTTRHSIFMDPSGKAAYGVLGLSDRIKDLLGASGIVIETGLFTYKQRIVCDGLISFVTRMAPGHRRDCNTRLADLRKVGAFTDRELVQL